MDHHFELIPEDEAILSVLEALGFRKTNFGGNIGETLKKMEKHFPNRLAIGLIDNDWTKPKLFDLYDTIVKERDDLQLRQKSKSRHFLIVIHPAIEEWLLQNARLAEIEHPFLGIKELSRVSKGEKKTSKEVGQYKRFLNALLQAKAPGILTMAEWIEELYDKHF